MFTGFTPQTTDFLWNLRFNNTKEWFLAHKQDYETLLLTPFRALANQVYAAMQDATPELSLNLHISRIYRDARRLFGRGPMKDHLWFTLFCGVSNENEVPAFFFSFTPEGYSYGMGYYGATAAGMARLRKTILANPAPMEQLARRFAAQDKFVLSGDTYARSKGTVCPVLQPWFDRKNLSLAYESAHNDRGYDAALLQDILDGYRFLTPYYRYLLTVCQQSDDG